MTFDFKYLTYEVDGKIVRITINRPRLLNAMHHGAVCELDSIVDLINENDDIRIVALIGAGRAFSTGIDLKDLAAGKIDMGYHVPWERALRGLETMDKIVLCLIHGYAIGGGLQLALACDIRASTPSAQLGLPAINEGLIPGLGTFRLGRYIGMGRAKQMILSGDTITGEQALHIGLVDHLVSEDQMADKFEELIGKYLQTNTEGCRSNVSNSSSSTLGNSCGWIKGCNEKTHAPPRARSILNLLFSTHRVNCAVPSPMPWPLQYEEAKSPSLTLVHEARTRAAITSRARRLDPIPSLLS